MAADEPRWARAPLRARLGTVRVRTTAAAVVVVGIALVVAAIATVTLLRRSLTNDVRTAGRVRAQTVDDLLQAGTTANEIPIGDVEEEFVQVVDDSGRVIASSSNLAGEVPVAELASGESAELAGLSHPALEEDSPFLVQAIAVETSEGPGTILVGESLETVAESSQVLVSLLVTGIPLLLVVVSVTTWAVVGRALAPVESIRAEVDAISTSELERRVPEPAGKDEIARLAATMNEMLARLEKGVARERRFVSDASHELRSPVTAIRQHVEVALSHPEQTSIEELAGMVLEENLRLQRIVEDLLLLSRIDEGTLRLQIAQVDLDDLVFEEASRIRHTADLHVSTEEVLPARVTGDSRQLGKLVRNLVENAARHARSEVAVSLSENHREAILCVDDDGRGIPASERRRVFDRFVRLDEARARDSGGSGLGLAIVAEVAAAHGGSAEALESPLGGARVEVRLPAG
jgi:signal transduction histidine kinase